MDRITAYIRGLWIAVGTRLKASFYLYLAFIFTLVVVADTIAVGFTSKMRQSSFDVMIRNRLIVERPDPDIVIVDIDEASLAAMAPDYGRWPWPRQVMGEFLKQLETQKPKAVVFDIIFSDPDVYNPDSDAYFNEAVASTDNTFFPVLRLDPANDDKSSVMVSQLPGAVKSKDGPAQDKTVAVVLPFFDAAMNSGRLGITNIYPDADGVTRSYTVYRKDYGWLIPSLPARLVSWLGGSPPERESVLLNWRGRPFTYTYVSFTDVFFDMTSKEKKRPADEFTGKIVIIGATAAGLFDVKATPVDRLFPGVEILATAIDNLKNDDYLRVPNMRLINFFLSLAIVWATAIAFYRSAGQEALDRLFGASQFLLIGVSYASINLMNAYINLTGPVMVGVAYFSAARIYAFATRKVLEMSAVTASVASEGGLYAAIMLVRLDTGPVSPGEKAVVRMGRLMARRLKLEKSVETLKGDQKGIWGLFERMTVVSWTCRAGDEASVGLIREEAKTAERLARELWQAAGGRPDGISTMFHEGAIDGGEMARAGWTALVGSALAGWRDDGRGDV